MDETDLSDEERRAVPVLAGTSHAVFVAFQDSDDNGPVVSLRFFTATEELPACGHGTVAALAFVADRVGGGECRATLRAPGRAFTGRATRAGSRIAASFDPGAVELRAPAAGEHHALLDALGVLPDLLGGGLCVASLGRPRLLVPVSTRSALATLKPNFELLRAACDQLGLLGCYTYFRPGDGNRAAARMFAPSIGVPEDIANANSTACLAAWLAGDGSTDLGVDMGDALGRPATITTSVRRHHSRLLIEVGGTASIRPVRRTTTL